MTYLYEPTYGYANARLKAMKTRLVGKQELYKMCALSSIPELVSTLEKTEMKEDLVELSIMYHGADLIDRSLGRNLARTYSKVISMTPKQSMDIVLALTGKWDIHNIKTILLGKHLGHDKKAIQMLIVPAVGMDERALSRLNSQPNVEETVFFLGGTEYLSVLMPKFEEYEKTKEINLLTHELERYHFRRLRSTVQHRGMEWDLIRDLICLEVDAKNILALMRHVKAGPESFDLEASFIRGGNVDLSLLSRLDGKKIVDICASVRKMVDLSKPLVEFEKDGSLAHFEVDLENRIYLMGLKAFRLSTLSVGSIVGFLYLKETESGNIRKITRGIEYNVDPERIKKTLVVI